MTWMYRFLLGWQVLSIGVLVCGATSTAQAQPSVTGRVLTVDGEPVPGLRVEFSAPESRQRWVAVSDADGRYAVRFGDPVTAVGERQGAQLPTTTRLSQNYPNPFNPSTEIEFDVLQPGPVRLGVYNLLGQSVQTLVDDWRSAGSYRVSWNGRDGQGQGVAAGVYIYVLSTPAGQQSRKMVLVDGATSARRSTRATPRARSAEKMSAQTQYTVRVTSTRIEPWTQELSISESMTLDLTGIVLLPATPTLERLDADADGRVDEIVLVEPELGRRTRVLDRDLDGTMDGVEAIVETIGPGGLLATQQVSLSETADGNSSTTSLAITGGDGAGDVLHMRTRPVDLKLRDLSAEDLSERLQQLTPHIVEWRAGGVVVEVPKALAADIADIEFFGNPSIEVLRADPLVLWDFTRVGVEEDGKRAEWLDAQVERTGSQLTVTFDVKTTFPLSPEDLRVSVKRVLGEEADLAVQVTPAWSSSTAGERWYEQHITVTHAPDQNGLYRFSLRVMGEHVTLLEGDEWHTEWLVQPPAGGASSALARYVAEPDSAYRYELVGTYPQEDYTTYVVRMTSQRWLTEAEVKDPLWWHWVRIVVPREVESDVALLTIGSGSRLDSEPVSSSQAGIAVRTKSVTAHLSNVPNQPVEFVGDDFGPRREGSLTAYGSRRFLESGAQEKDAKWLLRLPMTKSVVRAMDTVTDLCRQELSLDVSRFVVTGGSKRAWATWTTAAVDNRVIAIVPIVWDALNLQPSFQHAWRALGFWSPVLDDWEREGIFQWHGTPEDGRRNATVDPYTFREQLTMPKLLINGASDQIFLPDSWRFYWDGLRGEKQLRYVPNAGHGVNAGSSLNAFYSTIVSGEPRPSFSWHVEGAALDIQTETQPEAMTLWQATNPKARDFHTGRWERTPVEFRDDGAYHITVPAPEEGWTAFFVEFEFFGKPTVKLTTGVVVTPDTYPFPPFQPEPRQ